MFHQAVKPVQQEAHLQEAIQGYPTFTNHSSENQTCIPHESQFHAFGRYEKPTIQTK